MCRLRPNCRAIVRRAHGSFLRSSLPPPSERDLFDEYRTVGCCELERTARRHGVRAPRRRIARTRCTGRRRRASTSPSASPSPRAARRSGRSPARRSASSSGQRPRPERGRGRQERGRLVGPRGVAGGDHAAAQAADEPQRHRCLLSAGHSRGGQPEAGLDDRDVGEHVPRPAGVVEAAPVPRRRRAQPGPADPARVVRAASQASASPRGDSAQPSPVPGPSPLARARGVQRCRPRCPRRGTGRSGGRTRRPRRA